MTTFRAGGVCRARVFPIAFAHPLLSHGGPGEPQGGVDASDPP